MGHKLSQLIDFLSENLAHRKGLLPMIGVVLIAGNFVLQFVPGTGWIATTDLLLHVGLIVALLGVMIAWAL